MSRWQQDCSRRGSALIVVIWVVGLLAMFITSMAFDAQVEGRLTSYYRKRAKAGCLAQSGMEMARMLLDKQAKVTGDAKEKGEEGDRWFEYAKRLKKGAIRGLVEPLGEGTITLDIVPEPARRNINNLDLANNRNEDEVAENLERILEVGGITEDLNLWPELIDSFMDWIDADDEPRANGAETRDYYETLPEPYRASNRPFDTVEELLLVKGFNRAILFGGVLENTLKEGGEPVRVEGIADLLTTYGDGRVNVNSASARVLMTLPNVDDVVAGAVIEEREGWVDSEGKRQSELFENEQDAMKRIPDLNAPRTSRYLTTAEARTCRITSVGEVGGVRRTVQCIAEYAGGGKIKILRWWEEE